VEGVSDDDGVVWERPNGVGDGDGGDVNGAAVTVKKEFNYDAQGEEGEEREDGNHGEEKGEELNIDESTATILDKTELDVDDWIDFKLPASKSPIMEAMVVCAIKNWGIAVYKSAPNMVVFRVMDFDRYYKISRAICSKQHPTEDIGSRVKSLRRWFDNFPKKKDRIDSPNFLLALKQSVTKKVNEMIERNTRLLGVQKRRRRQ